MRWMRRIEELLGGFGIEAPDKFRRVLEVGKQHRDLFALAFQGTAGGEDFLRQMGRRVGQWGLWRGLRDGRGIGVTRPDEDPAVFLHRDAPHLDEFGFQIVKVRRRRAQIGA